MGEQGVSLKLQVIGDRSGKLAWSFELAALGRPAARLELEAPVVLPREAEGRHTPGLESALGHLHRRPSRNRRHQVHAPSVPPERITGAEVDQTGGRCHGPRASQDRGHRQRGEAGAETQRQS